MEYAVPLAFAWYIHDRSRHQCPRLGLTSGRRKRLRKGQRNTVHGMADTVGGQGRSEVPASPEVMQEALQAVELRYSDAVARKERELALLILQVCLLQAAVQYGFLERFFKHGIIKGVTLAHAASKKLLKVMLSPAISMARRIRQHAHHADAADEPVEPAINDDSSMQASSSDSELPNLSRTVIVISRPMHDAGPSSSSAAGDAAAGAGPAGAAGPAGSPVLGSSPAAGCPVPDRLDQQRATLQLVNTILEGRGIAAAAAAAVAAPAADAPACATASTASSTSSSLDSSSTSSLLGLPLCVAQHLFSYMDSDAKRVLRSVSRTLYFEVSKHIMQLVVQPDNLETLISMPLHQVMPHIEELKLRFPASLPGGAGNAQHAAQLPQLLQPLQPQLPQPEAQLPQLPASQPPGARTPRQHQQPLEQTNHLLLLRLAREVLPQLSKLRVLDVSESVIHSARGLWLAIVSSLPAHIHVVLQESTTPQGLPWEAGDGSKDVRDHFPALLEALKVLLHHHPQATVDLPGVTVRRHTATRLPQLCQLAALKQLVLYGKSAAALPHGHRLSGHLHHMSALTQLTSLELLSYEDISDTELAQLQACPSLRHLYVDSLFIKSAEGPSLPSITSLATARIKFILRPLTAVFPNLQRLRLGVLHSELNKKINSVSLSCLAGCSEMLSELVLCPVMWKGQWQVLPTLPGLRRLVLVHSRELGHLREVLKVVGRMPALQHLELQCCSPAVAAWPGGNGEGAALQLAPAELAAAAAFVAAVQLPPLLQPLQAAALPAPGAAAAAAAVVPGTEMEGDGTLDGNIFEGLGNLRTLNTLVLQECSSRLVRHLAAADLPQLRNLVLRKFGTELRLSELQAAVLNLTGLCKLQLEAAGTFTAAEALQLPLVLLRPFTVEWHSTVLQPSLFSTRGFGKL